MFDNKNLFKTPISEYGEFGLIEHLTKNLSLFNSSTLKSIGDDACVLDSKNKEVLVSSDTLVENIHFNLTYTPLKHLGYKAVVVGISDIIAMNAIPEQILISIAISNRFPVEALDEIYAGISTACNFYKIDLVGGDTTSSNLGLVINITAIGYAKKEDIVYRNGAKPNDLLVVTGDLGGAYFGLQVLERENVAFKANPNLQPDLNDYTYLLERQLKPEARVEIKNLLEEMQVHPTSMIDISDGLASEILHLSQKSNVGFSIYEDKIPMDNQVISTASEFGINPVTGVLNGGEDYEILFTIPVSEHDKIKHNPNFSIIGHATQNNKNFLVTKGQNEIIPLRAQGWEAYLKN
ncbi:thiamine-phosphate kinase [Apibacter muscae]|uniref:Thiamine-monophosphate kinase n=1 Tax=Apibacter muscae TaxID=2509004 RepID=A0A563DAK2_9FLAO|nr:thiamine-phosphate kinase [Apibacter muscae]TWP27338.1 thiamine-phosphate kinase [Apibacter muscae]TWP28558.1 thiamine-phosphate kinase [Apibacter muscae]